MSNHVPPGWPTVIPRLSVAEPRALVAFLQHAFAARGEFNESRPSELWLGDSLVMVGGTLERAPTAAFLYVYVADVDASYELALAAGAVAMEAPADMPYGDRRAMIEDPWGNRWQIATHLGFTANDRESAGGEGPMAHGQPVTEVFPLVWTSDVPALVAWAVDALGLVEAWRAPPNDDGEIEHAELLWFSGRISVNLTRPGKVLMGPSGISLRVDDRDRVDALYRRAVAAGASITQGPEETRIAYSFTATDADGNQWWVNAETGFLDRLRGAGETRPR